MKKLNSWILSAALVGITSLDYTANAQYRPTGDDGIAASPRLRKQLDERAASARVTAMSQPATVIVRTAADGVTASPRLQQMLAERKAVTSGSFGSEITASGYRATAADGIAASPKLREQLDERGPSFMVAPVK